MFGGQPLRSVHAARRPFPIHQRRQRPYLWHQTRRHHSLLGSQPRWPGPPQVYGEWGSVSTGNRHTCAITTDGEAECCGQDARWPDQPITAITAGDDHICWLKADYRVACSGSNRHGQTTLPSGSADTYIAVSASGDATCRRNVLKASLNLSMSALVSFIPACGRTVPLFAGVTIPRGQAFPPRGLLSNLSQARRTIAA